MCGSSRRGRRLADCLSGVRVVATLLAFVTTVALAGRADAQTPSFVQGNYSGPLSSASSVTVTFPAAQSAGGTAVVIVGWGDATTSVQSVTDSRGNAYARAIGPTVYAGVATQSIYYAKNIAASAAGNAITVVFSATTPLPDVRIAEYSGIDPVNAVDVSRAAQGSASLSDTGSFAT